MAPETEQQILKKIDQIYTALFGVDGQPETGSMHRIDTRLNDHSNRIRGIENWRNLIVGGLLLGSFILGLIFNARH